MKIFKDKISLKREIRKYKHVSFIPTMGGLHKGHVSLIKKSKKYKLKTIVSIFVNPKQFNKVNDFKAYPRNITKDILLLKKLKVSYLYAPTFKDIYTFKTKKKVFLDKFSKILCGKYRKGHFEGVLNVVNRFLEIIKPKYIFLGKKDYQQLFLINKHIKKRGIKSKVIECNTIREKNKIAYSSRNSNLSIKQRKIASNISKFLIKTKKKYKSIINLQTINKLKEEVIRLGASKIDYLEIYNVKNFKKKYILKKNSNIFIAYFIKSVRLIDNF